MIRINKLGSELKFHDCIKGTKELEDLINTDTTSTHLVILQYLFPVINKQLGTDMICPRFNTGVKQLEPYGLSSRHEYIAYYNIPENNDKCLEEIADYFYQNNNLIDIIREVLIATGYKIAETEDTICFKGRNEYGKYNKGTNDISVVNITDIIEDVYKYTVDLNSTIVPLKCYMDKDIEKLDYEVQIKKTWNRFIGEMSEKFDKEIVLSITPTILLDGIIYRNEEPLTVTHLNPSIVMGYLSDNSERYVELIEGLLEGEGKKVHNAFKDMPVDEGLGYSIRLKLEINNKIVYIYTICENGTYIVGEDGEELDFSDTSTSMEELTRRIKAIKLLG